MSNKEMVWGRGSTVQINGLSEKIGYLVLHKIRKSLTRLLASSFNFQLVN
jgi:hypothetical protein